MKSSLLYSDRVDWGQNLRKNSPTFNSNRKSRKVLSYKPEVDFDYSRSLETKKTDKQYTQKRNFKESKSKKTSSISFNKIYYGILFVFVFGFLFFLSISITSAASIEDRSKPDNIFEVNDSSTLLEKYLFFNSNMNQVVKNRIKNYTFNKIEYFNYRVKPNDYVEKIAKKYGLSTETLLLVNNIKKNKFLRVGQVLTLPNQNGRIVTVRKNDSIMKLANRYGVSWEHIADVNNLDRSVIVPGMKIFIPGSKMTEYERRIYFCKNLIWPVRGNLSSYFGGRIDPFTGIYGFHSGIDIKKREGSKVKCANDGKVLYIGWNKVYGNFVIVKHYDNIVTTYAHLSKILVEKGQPLEQGSCLGLVGSTGRSTGPHLHFEIRENGKLINPLSVLN